MVDEEAKVNRIVERLDQLEIRFHYFEELFQHLFNTLNMSWAILLGVLAVIGIALYFIAQVIVERSVNSKLKEIQKRVREEIIDEIGISSGVASLKSRENDIIVTFPKAYSIIPDVNVTSHFTHDDLKVSSVTSTSFKVSRENKLHIEDNIVFSWSAIPPKSLSINKR